MKKTEVEIPEETQSQKGETFFYESLYPDFALRFRTEQILFESKTEHQHMVLFENKVFGKVLMLDGVTQVTSRDEFIYHEMLSHVPLLAHGAAKRVLIIGGGDCGLAEEVLKHKTVTTLTQVELDASVVSFSKEYFSDFNTGVFEDSRFNLVIDDGMRFVRETSAQFDVVLVDSTDPIGPGEALFSPEFYGCIRHCLSPGGIFVKQNGVPFFQGASLQKAMRELREFYSDVTAYLLAVPTYIGGFMTLSWACDSPTVREVSVETLTKRYVESGIITRYYTPALHKASFVLPRYIEDLVN